MTAFPENPGDGHSRPESITPDQARQLAAVVWAALGVSPSFQPVYSDRMAGDTHVKLCGYTESDVKVETFTEQADETGLVIRTTNEYHLVGGDPMFLSKEQPIDPDTGKPITVSLDFPGEIPYQMIADSVRAAATGDNLITEPRLRTVLQIISQSV